jgi:hypothetical protein
MAGVANG